MKSFNVENEIVKAYLSEVTYPDGYGHGSGETKIKPYIRKVVQRSPGNASAYTPNLSEQPKVCNLMPGTTVKVEGKVRMIHTNRCYNMRDIGGWKCGEGKHLAYGKVIRGAELGGLKDATAYGVAEDIETLTKEVGISVEFDLRGKSEYSVSPLGKSVKLYNNKSYACSGYSGFISGSTTKLILTTIINELEKGNTVYLHCAQGADRTGLICFVIEALCGCSEDLLIKDWELTSFVDYLNTKYISDEEGLRGVLKSLYDNYGGKSGKSINEQVYQFAIKKIGLSDTQIEKLRSLLVVSDEEIKETEKTTKTETIVIKDLGKVNKAYKYSVTSEGKTTECKSITDTGIIGIGKYNNEDSTMITDYVACKGYQKIEADYRFYCVCEFCDSNKKAFDWIAIEKDNGRQRGTFDIPSGTSYIRYLFVKGQGFTATLTKTTEVEVEKKEETKEFVPFEITAKDITIFKPYGISTGLACVNEDKDVNFGYFEIGKECYGHTLEVTYKGAGRGVSILTEVPPAKSGVKVNVVAGFSQYITKSWLCYVGTETETTKEIVIPSCGYDKLYVFVQCHKGKLECSIKVK